MYHGISVCPYPMVHLNVGFETSAVISRPLKYLFFLMVRALSHVILLTAPLQELYISSHVPVAIIMLLCQEDL